MMKENGNLESGI